MKYYMVSTRNNQHSYWERCKATTLTGAKREATREYGEGFVDSILMVATAQSDDELRQVLATKSNAPGSRWVNNA